MGQKRVIVMVLVGLLGLLILLLPRGCSSAQSELTFVSSGETGSFGAKVSLDQGALGGGLRDIEKALKSPISSLYSEQRIKKDWLVVAYYDYEADVDLSFVPQEAKYPITLSVVMPGRLQKTNAQQILGEENTAVWALASGREQHLTASSRLIRWWLIILLCLIPLILVALYFYKPKERT